MKGGKNSYNFGQFLQDQPFSYSNLGQLTQLKDTIQEQTILQQYFGENFVNVDIFKTAVRLIRSIADIPLDDGEEKNLIDSENFDTFKTYSNLDELEDNVWKKAKDGWNSYRESVKNIQEMIEDNEENDKNSILKKQLYALIDKTIELTSTLDKRSNSVIPMPGNPTTTSPSPKIKNFGITKIFKAEDYKDTLFLFFAKVIENHGTSDLKTKLGNEDYANASIKFLTDNQLNNKDDFFTILQRKTEGYPDFKREWYPVNNKQNKAIPVNEIVPGFMKTFKEILENDFAPPKSEFETNLEKYHQENIEKNFISSNPKGTYKDVYEKLTSLKADNEPIFSVWDLKDIQVKLNDSQYEADMKFIDDILGVGEELGPIGIYLIELELYTYGKLALANEVCSNRRKEGFLINNSLAGVRDMIRKILQAKNKSTLQLVPNYINICFDRYCPTHTNCFSFDTRNTKENTDVLDDKTVIYNTIEDYFHKENMSNRTPLSIENLVVGIFCVFNISQMANNPPPVPYVDINDLKRIVFNYNLFDEKYQKSKEGKKRITSFVLCAKELLDTIDNKFINTYKVGDSDQEKNLLESLKTGNPVKGFNKLKLIKFDGTIIKPEDDYNLYEIFKFLLNQLVNTREVAEDAKQYANDMSEKSKEYISEQSVLVETMEKKTEEEINNLGNFEQEIITKINNQDREINVNEVRKNEFTKIYQLNDLKKLVRFLKYDLKRLQVAEGSVEVFEEDGYDGFDFINNNLEEEHREEFYSEYILSKHIIDVEKTWGNCDELERERVYGDLRQYIEKTIASLFKTIFRGKNEKKIIAELIEFDMSIFKSEIGFNDLKIIREEKRTNMNNYLDNIQKEARKKEDERKADEARKAAEEEARKAAEEEARKKEDERKANLAQAEPDNPVRGYPDMSRVRKGISNVKSKQERKRRQQRGVTLGGGGGAELTVTNIDAIINYIGERVQYMRSDAFNREKIKELQNIIENYKGAINSLDNFIDYLNETINDYKARIMLISKDKIQLIESIKDIDTEMGKMEEEKEKYNKLKERYIEEYKSIENGLKDKQKKAIQTAVNARNRNKQKYYGKPLSKVFMHYLEDFLTSVDNLNAASAVGTLEFLDKMAKLNTVSTICNFNNSEIVESDLREKIGYNLKNLYEEITQ